VLPGLRGIEGYRGGYVLRSDGSAESEFIVINLFDSIESVKAFAGADYSTPVFEPETRALGIDEYRSLHVLGKSARPVRHTFRIARLKRSLPASDRGIHAVAKELRYADHWLL